MSSHFHGIAVYEIKPDGCLNGTWTDDHPDTQKEICNEIAKKIGSDMRDCIEGTYNSSWIEHSGDIKSGTLEIKKDCAVYDFIWRDNKKVTVYEGVGIRTCNTISVTYWQS